jgi:hypothetical protein
MAQFLGLDAVKTLREQPPACSMHSEAMKQFELGGDVSDLTMVAKVCVATIFVLSLFVPNASPESLYVAYETFDGLLEGRFPPRFIDGDFWTTLVNDINVLVDDRPGAKTSDGVDPSFDLTPVDLWNSALKLLGHTSDPRFKDVWGASERLAMSSFRGQTAFPDILHSLDLRRQSRVRVIYVHGDILWNGEKYNEVTTYTRGIQEKKSPESPSLERDVPYDSFQDCRLTWEASSWHDQLRISLGSSFSHRSADPMLPFVNMDSPLFVNCAHDRHDRFPFIDGEYHSRQRNFKIVPISAEHWSQPSLTFPNSDSRIAIVCSDHNTKARYYALCSDYTRLVVVRENACMDCCLKVCVQLKNLVIIC